MKKSSSDHDSSFEYAEEEFDEEELKGDAYVKPKKVKQSH